MSHHERAPKNSKSSSSNSQSGAQQKGSSQTPLEQLPGGIDLLEYKDILEYALQAFPDHDPGVIREVKVLRIRDNLNKVEVGIMDVRFLATRKQFAIDEEVVSYNVSIANNELAAVISLVRLYVKDTTSIADKAECSRQVDKSLKIFQISTNEALAQFAHIKPLKGKTQ